MCENRANSVPQGRLNVAQDDSPIRVNLIEGVTLPISRCFGKRAGDGAPVEQNGG